MEVKNIIRQRRLELGLTYEELGKMIGVGKSTVRKWETGLIENIRRDNIVALAKALNISPAEIMGWSNETENNNDNILSIGEKIKYYRKANKMTQIELANKAKISRSYLADIENNRYNASVETLKSIALSLNISISQLLTDDNAIEDNDIKDVELSPKAERDIKKALNQTLEQLENSQDALMFDGEPLDEETRELLKVSLENSMRLAKQIAKVKYTPKKYKEDNKEDK